MLLRFFGGLVLLATLAKADTSAGSTKGGKDRGKGKGKDKDNGGKTAKGERFTQPRKKKNVTWCTAADIKFSMAVILFSSTWYYFRVRNPMMPLHRAVSIACHAS